MQVLVLIKNGKKLESFKKVGELIISYKTTYPTDLIFVPPPALPVVDDWDLDFVEDVRARLPERVVRLPPSGDRSFLSGQRIILKLFLIYGLLRLG